jgi:hypothetical protein
MGSLSPLAHLQRYRIPRQALLECPTCKATFIAEQGVVFLSYWWTTNDQAERVRVAGHLTFCCASCVLNFVDDTESGHG